MNDQMSSLLVVDDEQLNLDMLSRRLKRSGFAVEVASSGRSALEMIRDYSFDLVLLDHMMPGMSGAEVLRTLRAEASTQALPVIMVTAVAESDKVAEALENGANDYITKPVDFQVALARIRSQLARKRAENALRQSEERYALAARASRDGLWDWNLLTGGVYFSPRWREMLGLAEDQVSNTLEAWFSRIIAGDRQAISDEVQQHLLATEDVLQCSYRMRHADGSLRWMACHGIVTRDSCGRPVRLSGSQSDVTEEKTRDGLTGLPNRLLMIGQLECTVGRDDGRAPSSSVSSYALFFLDLNGFKTINDSLGHVAGDYLLKAIATRLRLAATFQIADGCPAPLVARMGGDEFAVLLEGAVTAHAGAVQSFAGEVQRLMKDAFDLNGQLVHCTFSIGVSLASDSHHCPEDILREADLAMYAAKAQGRGEVVVFDPGMRALAAQQLELENDLRSAVRRGELDIVYQPKVNLATGRTYGVEALVRWNHPKRGLLQPGVFIPVAEQTGVIVEIGRWVLREACLQVRSWHKQFPTQPLLELSVNLSPSEFKHLNLLKDIAQALLITDFPPASLHLEITEGVVFEDMQTARATLFALKKMGIKLDIDDFGSGYSSLKYLRELPFDLLKIDRYFTANLDPEQPASEELIKTILSMANNLGLQVVAEGVETEPHSSTLQMLGCRFGQGFYFSKPVSPNALHALLVAQATAGVDIQPPLLANPVSLLSLQEPA